MAVAETIMRRLPIMWWEMLSPTQQGQAEMNHMVSEKQKAFVDGMVAAQTLLVQEVLHFWNKLFHAQTSGNAGGRIISADTIPYRHTVKANVKRLRKK